MMGARSRRDSRLSYKADVGRPRRHVPRQGRAAEPSVGRAAEPSVGRAAEPSIGVGTKALLGGL